MALGIPTIDLERCNGCGECELRCPSHVVKVVEGKMLVVRPEDCSYCTECETFCPLEAISCPLEIVLATEIGS